MAKTRRAKNTHSQQADGHESALIAHLHGEIAYLRAELAKRAEELARERERGDVLHREALARIDALASGTSTIYSSDDLPDEVPKESAESDSDPDNAVVEPEMPGPIHQTWDDLTEVLITELGMDPQAAWVAAAQELGIAHGLNNFSFARPIP